MVACEVLREQASDGDHSLIERTISNGYKGPSALFKPSELFRCSSLFDYCMDLFVSNTQD
jgi:hypothetical protein